MRCGHECSEEVEWVEVADSRMKVGGRAGAYNKATSFLLFCFDTSCLLFFFLHTFYLHAIPFNTTATTATRATTTHSVTAADLAAPCQCATHYAAYACATVTEETLARYGSIHHMAGMAHACTAHTAASSAYQLARPTLIVLLCRIALCRDSVRASAAAYALIDIGRRYEMKRTCNIVHLMWCERVVDIRVVRMLQQPRYGQLRVEAGSV